MNQNQDLIRKKIEELLSSGKRINLNLGAGNQPYKDFVGLDLGGYAADIIHDLRDLFTYYR